jgi:hypothetical protein
MPRRAAEPTPQQQSLGKHKAVDKNQGRARKRPL